MLEVSGREITNSIPGKDLMSMAVLKLLREGSSRNEIAKFAAEFAWDIENAIERGKL